MGAYVINVQQVLSASFIEDVVITAIEGGINYWATSIHDEFGALHFELQDTPEKGRLTVTYEMVAEAIQRLVNYEQTLAGSYIFDQIFGAVMRHDAGGIDASGADVIVQVAALGEVVYG